MTITDPTLQEFMSRTTGGTYVELDQERDGWAGVTCPLYVAERAQQILDGLGDERDLVDLSLGLDGQVTIVSRDSSDDPDWDEDPDAVIRSNYVSVIIPVIDEVSILEGYSEESYDGEETVVATDERKAKTEDAIRVFRSQIGLD